MDNAKRLHEVRLQARVAAELEARNLIRDRMIEATRAESLAVRAALDAGVPRLRLAIDSLGTTDYHTVSKILEVTETEATQARETADLLAASGRYVRLATADERAAVPALASVAFVARVDWPAYATPEGPANLHGLVIESTGRVPFTCAFEDAHGGARPVGGPLSTWAGRSEQLDIQLREVAAELTLTA